MLQGRAVCHASPQLLKQCRLRKARKIKAAAACRGSWLASLQMVRQAWSVLLRQHHERSPVQVLCGVAHAVDAVVAWEVVLHRVLQRRVIALAQCRAPSQSAAGKADARLAVHLDPCDACEQPPS